ncbi:MAG: InlB B-repeat-containing protein, partial [Firmicutes bacterium]|nr:InlB B-repeat-containing protein [Bacillota bacterium]
MNDMLSNNVKIMGKRGLSLLLSLLMLAGCMGTSAFADDPCDEHVPSESVVENEAAASCTEAGSYDMVIYCSVCGEELSRETVTVEALGHEWDEGTVTLAPTTETEGVMTYNCLNCDEVMTAVLDKLPPEEPEEQKEEGSPDHEHSYSALVTDPTCTENGYTTHVCSICEYTYTDNLTDPLGHEPEAVDALSPTESETGHTAGFVCSRCGEILEGCEELPVLQKTVITIEKQPEDAAIVNGRAEFTVVASVNKDVELSYQWQRLDTSLEYADDAAREAAWEDIENETNTIYLQTIVENEDAFIRCSNYIYRCLLQSENTSLYTKEVKIAYTSKYQKEDDDLDLKGTISLTGNVRERMNAFQEVYSSGTTYTEQCYNFACREFFPSVFGGNVAVAYYGHIPDDTKNTILVGRLCDDTLTWDTYPKEIDKTHSMANTVYGTITSSSCKDLLQYAWPGDILQITFKRGGVDYPHTMIIDEVTNTGIKVYHANYSPDKVTFNTVTWSSFLTLMNLRDGTKATYCTVSLYRAKNYETINDGPGGDYLSGTTYNITFNPNGGSGSMPAISVSKGTQFTIPECTFTNEGYSCNKWHLKRSDNTWLAYNGSFVDYDTAYNNYGLVVFHEGQNILDEDFEELSNEYSYSFYAIWEETIYEVKTEEELRVAVNNNRDCTVTRNITLSSDLLIPVDQSINLCYAVLTVPEGVTLTNNGRIEIGDTIEDNDKGILTVNGSIINNGNISILDGDINQQGIMTNNGSIDVGVYALPGNSWSAAILNSGQLYNKGTILICSYNGQSSNSRLVNTGLYQPDMHAILIQEYSYIQGVDAKNITLYTEVSSETELNSILNTGYKALHLDLSNSVILSSTLSIPSNCHIRAGNPLEPVTITVPAGVTLYAECSAIETGFGLEIAPDETVVSVDVYGTLYLSGYTSVGINGTINVYGRLVECCQESGYGMMLAGKIHLFSGGELINYSKIQNYADASERPRVELESNGVLRNYGWIAGINDEQEMISVVIDGASFGKTVPDIWLEAEEAATLAGIDQDKLSLVWQADLTGENYSYVSFFLNGSNSAIYVFHYEDGAWKLISTSSGPNTRVYIEKFSPFAIAAIKNDLSQSYSVSYDANGGSGAPAAQTKTHGTALTLSSARPTRSGYTFVGWSEDISATTAQYQPGGRFTKDASVTLYAVWKANTPPNPADPVEEFVRRCYRLIL